MKTVFSRNYRRRSRSARTETPFFKKESQETFFNEPVHETFFQPVVTQAPLRSIHRQCDECEGGEQKAQRQPEKKEEEKKVQKATDKKEEEKVMKKEDKKEEEKVMKKEDKKEEEKVQKKETALSTSPGKSVSNYINSLSGKGQPLPGQANYFFSSRMGYDFSDVKVHTDKEAAESAKAINAKAYTIGNNVVFNEGQYNTESGDGKRLMAHELTHVIQQDKQNNLIERAAEETVDTATAPVNSDKWSHHNTTHYGFCKDARGLHGKTEAHYTDKSSNKKDSRKKSTACPKGCRDCIVETGKLISEFKASPTTQLPPVPANLNACEKKAVKGFINGELKIHEQKHASRFNTYTGKVETPYTFTGCASDLNAFLKEKHIDIRSARQSDSDTLSSLIDPFFGVFDCECPDPEPKKSSTKR